MGATVGGGKMRLHKDNNCGLPPRDCGHQDHWVFIGNMQPPSPPTQPSFVDDRPEGGEGSPIVRAKDPDIDDPRIDWGYPRPNDLDIVRVKMGEEAVEQAKVGMREAERREAYVEGFRTEPEDTWDESLEDVEGAPEDAEAPEMHREGWPIPTRPPLEVLWCKQHHEKACESYRGVAAHCHVEHEVDGGCPYAEREPVCRIVSAKVTL